MAVSRVAFMGSKAVGLAVLRKMIEVVKEPHKVVGVLCPDDSDDGRSEQLLFRKVGAAHGLPFEQVGTVRDAEQALRRWRPDVVIVLGWYFLIRLERFPETRFFGFHFSPLPRYRGNAPLVWQIINGEPKVGTSFFEFSSGMDEGDIVAQASAPLAENETIGDALQRLESASTAMLESHLPGLLDGTAVLLTQDHSLATYCGLRVPEDGRVDWHWEARRIHNFIRSQTRPYPGAFTALPDGRIVRIWRSEVDPRPYVGVPGAVAERSNVAVVVTCGEGAVRILEAQVDGEPEAPVATIFSSLRFRMR